MIYHLFAERMQSYNIAFKESWNFFELQGWYQCQELMLMQRMNACLDTGGQLHNIRDNLAAFSNQHVRSEDSHQLGDTVWTSIQRPSVAKLDVGSLCCTCGRAGGISAHAWRSRSKINPINMQCLFNPIHTEPGAKRRGAWSNIYFSLRCACLGPWVIYVWDWG